MSIQKFLPGFPVTQQWQYPTSVYQVYDETESSRCKNGVEITDDPRCACCAGSRCANRLIDGTGAVEARCVGLGMGVGPTKYKTSGARETETLVTEYHVEDTTGSVSRKKKRRSRRNRTTWGPSGEA